MFKKKVPASVTEIMTTFNETIDKLTTHAASMDIAVAGHETEEKKIAEAKATALKEAEQARNIANKLANILN